jgi:hypothetical protein
VKGLQAEKEALSSPWKPKKERELPIVFHEDAFCLVFSTLIAPGSRLVGFGPTTGASYTFAASDSKQNVHVLSRYEIDAPNVIRRYKRELFIIHGRFFDSDNQLVTGDNLLVQCILVGPLGQYRVFPMQDNGKYCTFPAARLSEPCVEGSMDVRGDKPC